MMVTGVLRIAAFGAATGARVSAAPAALAWSAPPQTRRGSGRHLPAAYRHCSLPARSIGGSLAGVYGGLHWRTWAAGTFGRDADGDLGEDALVLGAAVFSVRQERCC